MSALTDEQRDDLATFTAEGDPDWPRAADAVKAALTHIDELERLYEGMIQEAVKANAKTAETLARNAQLAEDNLRLALAKKAATDRVVELRAMLEEAPLHHGFMCGWCNGQGVGHDADCAYVDLLKRTAP